MPRQRVVYLITKNDRDTEQHWDMWVPLMNPSKQITHYWASVRFPEYADTGVDTWKGKRPDRVAEVDKSNQQVLAGRGIVPFCDITEY